MYPNVLMLLLISLALTGCASMGASSTEPLLSAAGFRVRTPENAEQRELYDAMPAYRIQRGTHEGKVFYAYKDEKQGVAYVGGEEAYEKYQMLAQQQSLARAQYDAARMNEMTAARWYGAYPPGRYGFY